MKFQQIEKLKRRRIGTILKLTEACLPHDGRCGKTWQMRFCSRRVSSNDQAGQCRSAGKSHTTVPARPIKESGNTNLTGHRLRANHSLDNRKGLRISDSSKKIEGHKSYRSRLTVRHTAAKFGQRTSESRRMLVLSLCAATS